MTAFNFLESHGTDVVCVLDMLKVNFRVLGSSSTNDHGMGKVTWGRGYKTFYQSQTQTQAS